jgi:hypothetical protein
VTTVIAHSTSRTAFAVVAALALATAGCGKFVRDQGTSPAQVVIMSLTGASGAKPTQFGIPVLSDVITNVTSPAPCTSTSPCATTFDDLGQVVMQLVLKDPGQTDNPSTPSALNQVTFDRLHVQFVRSDGKNTEGVDVPYAFDAAATFTVTPTGTVTQPFELVHHSAKDEAPLRALRTNGQIINAIANITFYGHDQAGNAVTATGSLSVNFGDFADPS